jgi:hypothetical protein
MRSDITLSREKRIRDELLLQRRLGKSRRAASALLPTLQRTGLKAKTARPPLHLVSAKRHPGREAIEAGAPNDADTDPQKRRSRWTDR